MIRNQTYQRLLRSALSSVEDAHRIANGGAVREGDYQMLQAAASQATQAARELNQLLGFVQACDDVERSKR